MKRWPVILLLFFAALLVGCGGSHDARVTAMLDRADSLLRTSDAALHDSVRQELEALDTARALRSDEALCARHALLLVQARYKCYVTEPADSALIDSALRYYADHHGSTADHERYTRALIYSGAVAEELGHPQQAMQWYLEAEQAADPNDHFNLGFTNLRIAYIYHSNLLIDSILIQKYTQAYNHFLSAKSSHYQLICLTELGTIYSAQNTDSALHYISRALELAKIDSDKFFLASNYTNQCCAFFYIGNYAKAKNCALKALNCGYEPTAKEIPKCMMLLSRSYAALGMADSAHYYADRVVNVKSPADSVNYYCMMADINCLDGDSLQYHRNNSLAANTILFSDSVSSSLRLHFYQEMLDNRKQGMILQNEQSKKLFFVCLSVFLLIIIGCMIWFHRKLMNRRKLIAHETIQSLKQELNVSIENFAAEKDQLERNLRHEIARLNECLMKVNNCRDVSADSESLMYLCEVIENQLDVTSNLISCSYEYEKNPRKFLEEFKDTISRQSTESGFMDSLKSYVSARYKINLQEMQLQYGFSDVDVNFICLSCCNFPSTVMMVMMGFSNTSIVANKKQKLKKKVKAESYNQFIHTLKTSY